MRPYWRTYPPACDPSPTFTKGQQLFGGNSATLKGATLLQWCRREGTRIMHDTTNLDQLARAVMTRTASPRDLLNSHKADYGYETWHCRT